MPNVLVVVVVVAVVAVVAVEVMIIPAEDYLDELLIEDDNDNDDDDERPCCYWCWCWCCYGGVTINRLHDHPSQHSYEKTTQTQIANPEKTDRTRKGTRPYYC